MGLLDGAAEILGRDVGVDRGRLEARVAEELLDVAHVGMVLQEMRRTAVEERAVGRHSFPQNGHVDSSGLVQPRDARLLPQCGQITRSRRSTAPSTNAISLTHQRKPNSGGTATMMNANPRIRSATRAHPFSFIVAFAMR